MIIVATTWHVLHYRRGRKNTPASAGNTAVPTAWVNPPFAVGGEGFGLTFILGPHGVFLRLFISYLGPNLTCPG
jgi:hypothetical protein